MQLGQRGLRVIAAFVVAVLVIALYAFLIEPSRVRIRNITVYFPDLPPSADGLCIAHISDLHIHHLGARERKLLRIIERNPPDLIAFTGDLASASRYRNVCLTFLSGLRARFGVWAVQGNWEHYTGWNGDLLLDDLQRVGVKLLVNQAQMLNIDGARIWIAGTDDPSLGADRIRETLSKTENGFVILLAHSPEILNRVPNGVQLILSGHTHGGQIRLPLIGAPWGIRMGGGYLSGLYRQGGTMMYVTNGVGTTILPARFLCPPEVAYLTLRSSEV